MSLFDRMGQGTQQNQMQSIKNNPIEEGRKAGYNIPENLAGNPQAMVMHLIQSGQVGGPMMQRILPMMQRIAPYLPRG
jgi:hypothetical protein